MSAPGHSMRTEAVTVRDALAAASRSIDVRDAELLAGHVLGCDRAWLIAHAEDPMPEFKLLELRLLTARRAAHEPVQYLTGEQEFYGLAFAVTRDVLIPRPETEHLVEAVELWSSQGESSAELRIADVGTGSGAIAVALATHVAGVRVTAIDISDAALAVARRNAERHACADRIDFRQGDLLEGFAPASFDVVASNPPYVPAADAATMQPEVVGWEPHNALFAGEDGLDAYRRLIPQAHTVLRPGGLLAMEFGYGQRDALKALLRGWKNARFIDDLQGIPRVVVAER